MHRGSSASGGAVLHAITVKVLHVSDCNGGEETTFLSFKRAQSLEQNLGPN